MENKNISLRKEIKSLILNYMEKEDRAYTREELVSYVYSNLEDTSKLNGKYDYMSSVLYELTRYGKLVLIEKGIYKKGSRNLKVPSIEKIYTICNNFSTDIRRACKVELLIMTDEERKKYMELVTILNDELRHINEFMDDIDRILEKDEDIAEKEASL